MLHYSFLTLSLILAVPGTLIWALRPDLRPAIYRAMVVSIPFAFTERLFYPDYWRPEFLFDLVNHIGFGIEDLIFVAGLGAFTTTAWPFVAGKTFSECRAGAPRRFGVAFGACVVMVIAVIVLDIAMIYGAPVVMALLGTGILLARRDLVASAIGGATITTVVYTAICLVLMWLIPDVFALDWNTSEFLDTYLFGVPVEELLYASTAGYLGAVFYPYWQGSKLVGRSTDARRWHSSSG